MPADLVTRLLLNSNQFDNSLRQSANEIREFQKKADGITRSIGKFAAGLGLAMSAGEALNKVIHGSQQLGDAFDNTLGSLTDTVENTFRALSTGNFSMFNDGLFTAISRARELREILDSLGDAQLSNSYVQNRFMSALSNAQAVVSDSGATDEQKRVAIGELEAMRKKAEQVSSGYVKTLGDALGKKLSNMYGGSADIDSFRDYITNYNVDANAAELDAYKKRYAQYVKLSSSTYTTQSSAGAQSRTVTDMGKLNALIKQNNDERLELMRLYNNGDDAQRKELTEMLAQYEAAMKQVADNQRAVNRVTNKAALPQSVSPAKMADKADEVLPEGSLAELNRRINSINKQITLEVDPGKRADLYKELQELQQHVVVIKFMYETPAPGEIARQLEPLAKGFSIPDKLANPLEGQGKTMGDFTGKTKAAASAVGSLSSAFDSLGSSSDEPVLNIMGTIGQAVATLSLSFAEAMRGSAALGPWGWLAFGAAGLSQLVAMTASIKSMTSGYASGGIVGGNSTIGDMNLARVNSGEMILNNRQQRNLFNLLDGNGTASRYSGNNEVVLKIKGRDLVGVLSNYNNARNKVL